MHRRLADIIEDPHQRARYLAVGTEARSRAAAGGTEHGAAVAAGRGARLERVAPDSRTLTDMSYISALVASLDTRLDELAAEIVTLEDTRATLQRRTLAAPSTAAPKGATSKRPRRLTAQTKTPGPKARRPATDPKPELAVMAASGSWSRTSEPRRRASATTTPRSRAGSSGCGEQLERLLADARSGLSAGAIAEQAGVGYSRVLSQLRELEAGGKVRRTGNRRSTLWLLITDEDRIAQRAADLERLTGARRDDRTQRRGRARAS